MHDLRHPVESLISRYFFWRSMPPDGHPLQEKLLREHPTIETFAGYDGIRRLMSQTFFGGYDMRRLDFIGFYETLADDLATLGKLLGIPLNPGLRLYQTVAPKGEREAVSSNADCLRRLTNLLKEDVSFYERLRAERALNA